MNEHAAWKAVALRVGVKLLFQHNEGYRGFYGADEINGAIPFKEPGVTKFHVIEMSAYDAILKRVEQIVTEGIDTSTDSGMQFVRDILKLK